MVSVDMAKFPGKCRLVAISASEVAKPTRFTHPISEQDGFALEPSDALANELQ
jgi:hypothetical protein